ncbi:MAG: hypothetical protein WCA09_12025 [Burkholderiales bacterium]
MYSFHFDRSKDLRNANPGLGVEVTLAPEHVVMGGTFINSRDARSHYAAYAWRPLQGRWAGLDVGAGVILAAMDGYPTYREGGWFVAPLPVVSLEGRYLGVNLSVIPTLSNRIDGAFVVQLKLRVW